MKHLLCRFLACITLCGALSAQTPDITNLETVFQSVEGFSQIDCSVQKKRARPERSTAPNKRVQKSSSTNWSGYVAKTSAKSPKKNSVSFVSGAWTVPTLSSTPDATYCSAWVGIDGDPSPTVEQIGTEHDWSSGSQQDYAWFEMYPNPSYEIVDFPLTPGDTVAGVVSYLGSSVFQLMLINYTQQVFFIVPTKYTASGSAKRQSAEWIMEAPSLSGILPLANFGTIAFSECSATISGVTGAIGDTHWVHNAITMVGAGNVTKATPSDLTNGGSAFTVTWSHE